MPTEITPALIGLLGIIVGVIPTYLFIRQRSIAEIDKLKAETAKTKAEEEKIRAELQPLRDELSRVKKKSAFPPMLSCEEYGIEIKKPSEYENIGQSFRISGTYKNLPEGQTIWTATFGIYDDGKGNKRKRYWPQEQAATAFTANGKEWYCAVNHIGGGNNAEPKEFLILVVGVEGQALFHYFKTAGGFTKQWLPITQLTTDIVECTIGRVVFVP